MAFEIYHLDERAFYNKYNKQVLGFENLKDMDGRYAILLDSTKKEIKVIVRGTAIPKNGFHDIVRSVYLDFKMSLVQDSITNNCMHSGFRQEAELIYQQILSLPKHYINQGYKFIIVGHSLGGAVAVIVAVYLFENHHPLKKCVTFGQPKFTDEEGTENLQGLPILRIVSFGDIVPSLPPATLDSDCGTNYKQIDSSLILMDSIYLTWLPEALAENPLISDSWQNMHKAKFSEHSMELYIERLSNKYKRYENVPYDDDKDFYENLVER